jgi:hypothetical protein
MSMNRYLSFRNADRVFLLACQFILTVFNRLHSLCAERTSRPSKLGSSCPPGDHSFAILDMLNPKFKGYKIVGLFRVYVPAELSVSPCVLDSHRYRVLRYLRNRTRIENMTK